MKCQWNNPEGHGWNWPNSQIPQQFHIPQCTIQNRNVNWMGLLPDRQNCGLRMRRECRECFSPPPTSKKQLVSDPGMHHGTCVTHVPWCMSGSLAPRGGENVPSIPGACATRNFTYLARGPWSLLVWNLQFMNNAWTKKKKKNSSIVCCKRSESHSYRIFPLHWSQTTS